MAKEFIYYQKNVPYHLGVRMNVRDVIGKLLTSDDPFIAVELEELRDFKVANKKAIMDGLLRITAEPNLEWDTPNTVNDEEIHEFLRSYLKLKSRLLTITSVPIVQKFLRIAKETNRSDKIIGLIQERLNTLQDLIESPSDMRGVDSV